MIAALLIAAFAIGLDQWTKFLAEANLDPQEPVRTLGGLVYLSLTWNSGAAFSLGTDYTWIFTIIASAVVVFLIVLSRRIVYPAWSIAIGLVLGGAAGNLVDRYFREPGFAHGHVVDFISVFKPYARGLPDLQHRRLGAVLRRGAHRAARADRPRLLVPKLAGKGDKQKETSA